MAVNFTKQKKKQKYLLYIVGAVILITIAVLYFGYFRGKSETFVAIPEKVMPAALVNKININLEVLENPFLKHLEPFEGIPDFEGEKGRGNPFLPY